MAWNDGLTGPHLDIAAYPGQSLRVIAGPGTGKTYALMRRIARMLEVDGVPSNEILAVTFTRTAAKDLVDQLRALGVRGADEVRATTVHALCFGLLMEGAVCQQTGRTPRPLLSHEREMLVNDLAAEFQGKRKTKRLIAAFEAYWATLQHHQPGWPTTAGDRAFNKALRDWLLFHGAMLIGEVVTLALDYLRANPHAQAAVDARYPHIVVDEYQDLNKADQSLIDALALPTSRVTVVGDEDQSIFSFRFAHPEGITGYATTHAGTADVQLDDCRRCPPDVVQMAAALIQNNTRVKTSVIQPGNAPAGETYCVQHDSLTAEAECLAAFVDWYLAANPNVQPGKVLILSPRRQIGYGIRDTLNAVAAAKGRQWSSQSFFTEECLDTEEAQTGFTLLTLLAAPDDAAALRTWLGLGDSSGRAKAYARVVEHCHVNGATPKDVLDSMVAGSLHLPYTGDLVAQYEALAPRLTILADLQGQDLVDALFPAVGGECDELRAMTVDALLVAQDPKGLLDELRARATQPDLPDDHSQVVRVMSLHKSKGLTCTALIVAGCVAGAIPTIDEKATPAEQMKQWEEQRRLFYVALTRTTRTLVISSATRVPFDEAKRMRLKVAKHIGRTTVELQASPFMAEISAHAPRTQRGTAWRRALGF